MSRWLLCDYGNVLSEDQPPPAIAQLAELAGLDIAQFSERYWAQRLAYDRADLTAQDYWTGVTGGRVEGELLGALVSADVASWSHLNLATVAATARAATRGFRLALLSNAPIEVARALDDLEELAPFSPRWFSCDLRSTKPDRAVYQKVLAALGSPAASVTFVDDRPENVAAAQALGIQAVVFREPAQIDEF